MMHVKYLLVFALNIILAKSAPECIGCADDSSCHVFDTDLNYKMVGCYGTFTGGGGGLADLCSVHFDPVSAADAAALGFTQAMCDSTPDNEVFFFNEGTSFTQCNTDSGGSDINGMLACTGTNSSAFDSGSVPLGSLCSGISDFAVVATIATIIEIETFNQAFTTLDLIDASYGGAICIRGPTPSPTEIPSNYPTEIPSFEPTNEPTNEPTYVPTEPSFEPTEIPSSEPTKMPTVVPTDTFAPTGIPSVPPTSMPSNNPTTIPSPAPSNIPTGVPTTGAPTKEEKQIIEGIDDELLYIGGAGGIGLFICICILIICAAKSGKKDSESKKNLNGTKQSVQMGSTSKQSTGGAATTASPNDDLDTFSIKNVNKAKVQIHVKP